MIYGFIYKITNLINNKIYIGKAKNVDRRFKQHLNSSKKLSLSDSTVPLHNAMRKYGVENFIIETIASAGSLYELNELEKYYIAKLKATDRTIGYNIQPGGDGGNWECLPADTKQRANAKRSIKLKNTYSYKNKLTGEIRRLKKEDITDEWEPWHANIKYTEESRQKMSNSAKNRIKNRGSNTLGKIRICHETNTSAKGSIFVTKEEFEMYYRQLGYIQTKYRSKKALNKLKNKSQKYAEFRKHKVLARLANNKAIWIDIDDKQKYIDLGYKIIKTNKDHHSAETIEKMRHPHKKMKSTEKLAHPKWIYIFNKMNFEGLQKFQNYMISIGYNLSMSTLDKIATNKIKQTSRTKFPELVGKIQRIEKEKNK